VTNKQSVTCSFCSQSINQLDYAEHIQSCSNERKPSVNRRHGKNDTSNENSTTQSPQVNILITPYLHRFENN
jgi:hypothetical protein